MKGKVAILALMLSGCASGGVKPTGDEVMQRSLNAMACFSALASSAVAVEESPDLRKLGKKPDTMDVLNAINKVNVSTLPEDTFQACEASLSQIYTNVQEMRKSRMQKTGETK